MKYSNASKARRNRAIVAYYETNPDVSMKEIGALFGGITKQRIWKILTQRTCRNCYHSLAKGALCACREKADMVKHFCPDWYSNKFK